MSSRVVSFSATVIPEQGKKVAFLNLKRTTDMLEKSNSPIASVEMFQLIRHTSERELEHVTPKDKMRKTIPNLVEVIIMMTVDTSKK